MMHPTTALVQFFAWFLDLCYVGQQRLHKAIQAFGPEKVQVEWKPFQIDPCTDLAGETVDAYCRRRWGGAGWTNHLKSEGRKDGANFGNWRWWPATAKAHQLVQYCAQKDICSTDRVNALLFQAEYEQGENISLVDTLVKVGEQAGATNLDELRTYLCHDQGKSQVDQEIASGRRRYGISGVPFFVISGPDSSQRPYGFSGAQSSDTFVDVFQELVEKN
ncbi:thiol oxidoreductase [Nitzschia inconspicua]|uniref:Thiol oxidoreductase n=1 Tax=Nitzschia inconspicua TaxID=303405 RepID=A0A9K3LX62_9STRA|nr:thiol oxidoreductase [Nitzschia inconspicua]